MPVGSEIIRWRWRTGRAISREGHVTADRPPPVTSRRIAMGGGGVETIRE